MTNPLEVIVNHEGIIVDIPDSKGALFCKCLNEKLLTFGPYLENQVIILVEGDIRMYYDYNSLSEDEHKELHKLFYEAVKDTKEKLN